MPKRPHVVEGQQVELLIYDATARQSFWQGGFTVRAIKQALDRPYRVDASDGDRCFEECAPECVRAAQQVAA